MRTGCKLDDHLLESERPFLSKVQEKLPREAQGEKKRIEGHPKEDKKSQTIYTQTNYTQTPDPPPYSGQVVLLILLLVIAYC